MITVQVAELNQRTTDATLVLPKQVLGTHYYVLSYLFVPQSRYQQGPSQMAIVVPENDTQIIIKLTHEDAIVFDDIPDNILHHFDGKLLTFEMHRCQTLQVCHSIELRISLSTICN